MRRDQPAFPGMFHREPEPHFDGSDVVRGLDHDRLTLQLEKIRRVIRDGQYRTLAELARLTGAPEASVSAQLRNLRKPRFGGLTIVRRRRTVDGGTWEYAQEVETNGADC